MSFNLPPLSREEKEKKADAFVNFTNEKSTAEQEKPVAIKKEKTKAMPVRFPASMMENIREISALTGLSMNSTILELIRPAIKARLKELKE